MEGNFTSDGNVIPDGQAFALSDSQDPLQFHQCLNPQIFQQGPQFQNISSFRLENMKEIEKPYEGVKKLKSDDDGMSFDEGGDGFNGGKEKSDSLWQRVKWTEPMVKLLINAVSYVEKDASSDCLGGMRRKPSMLQKIGKWRCVSKLMVRKGFHVSPQQCEDKFNDLNKRYKRLIDILGRGISCKVVKNPKLLDTMDVSDKAKEEVKKILNSKNLFYEEMCSYHNGNRLHLPHDMEVQRSLQWTIRSRDNYKPNLLRQHEDRDEYDKKRQDTGAGEQTEETKGDRGTFRFEELSSNRSKQMNVMKDEIVGNPLTTKECGIKSGAAKQDDRNNLNYGHPKDSSADGLQEQWMAFRLLQLKEQKMQIQVQKLALEMQRYKWKRINWKKDKDLDKMRLDNHRMKLENEWLAFELKPDKSL
ncbi:hypothetical protein CCACVL1_13270 [Corchorus capsularis]|uniref:Myb/SANT-like DNA-binding domain-containing protein n=1 Tax=Corchorus capsularis TaxID=210143 RepID=A0A1R3IBL7_COCAP|nr:hypothetical protein CCACVL1_13270 [Corchorus capsularis]